MLKRIISFFNTIIKKKRIILFNSYPFFADNAKSIYDYIIQNRPDIVKNYTIFWVVDEGLYVVPPQYYNKLNIVKKKSIKGIYLFLHAKYIFATHGYFKNIHSPNSQYNVNLWHGCGYKGNPKTYLGYRGNYNIVTSEVYKPIHSVFFTIPENNILITGLPRNDQLFCVYNSLEKLGVDRNQYNKIVLWMPTYRNASVVFKETEGSIEKFGFYSILNNIKEYDKLLQKQNIFLIIKPHPLEEDLIDESLDHITNIKVITNHELDKYNLSIYNVMQETDVLLSDYSSVVVDYLLTDGDIALVIGDYEEYSNCRGFVFNNIEEMLPGPMIHTEMEFQEYLNNMNIINLQYKMKLERIKKKMHYYADGKASERIVSYFFDQQEQNNKISNL